MGRKLNARERYLLAAVPTLAVLAVYVFAFYRPQQAVLAEAARRLREAQKDLTTAGEVPAKRAELARKQEQVQAEKRDLADRDGRPTVLYAGVAGQLAAPGGGEAAALTRVSRILRDRSIVVVTSSRVPDGEAGALLPADLREASKQLSAAPRGAAGPAGAAPPAVWRLELIGGFAGVREALEDLAAADALVVPVGISMEPAKEEESDHLWKLWIWM